MHNTDPVVVLESMNKILSKLNVYPAHGVGGWKGYQTVYNNRHVYIPFIAARQYVGYMVYHSHFHKKELFHIRGLLKDSCWLPTVNFTQEQVDAAMKVVNEIGFKNYWHMTYTQLVYSKNAKILKIHGNEVYANGKMGWMSILQDVVDNAFSEWKQGSPEDFKEFSELAIEHKYSDDFFAKYHFTLGMSIRNEIINFCSSKKIQLDFDKGYWLDDVWVELVVNSLKGK